MSELTVGSLFSGIGGLDLGLERAGMKVIWQSEIDDYASKILSKHWPNVPNHGDITKIEWGKIERPDIICGGYPCQPFSQAGKRRGEEDSRHLWPHFREAISNLRPRYAVLENVRGHLSLGGLSVVGQLASIGYDAEWRIISAASIGACHRRDRLFIVAYPNGKQLGERGLTDDTRQENRRWVYHGGRQTSDDSRQWWQTEPDVGRVAHGISNRVDRLRGLGNAVVPQVAELIGRLIIEHSNI